MPALLSLLMLPAAAQELTTAAVNAGGGLTSGGDLEMTGSFGAFGEVSGGDDITARAGFPGQIYDPASIAITPAAAVLQENDIRSFAAEIVCDDDTFLPASAVAWSVDSPLLNVSAAGEVTTGLLPGDFAATLTASTGGVSGAAMLSITDTDPDNYRDYAGDGLPDDWQILHFSDNRSTAGPAADPDGDGQDNATEYSAGTDPNDPHSLLRLAFVTPSPAPGTAGVVFSPYLPGRTYTLDWSATLDSAWSPLSGLPVSADGPGEGLFTVPAAVESRKLYRLRVTLP